MIKRHIETFLKIIRDESGIFGILSALGSIGSFVGGLIEQGQAKRFESIEQAKEPILEALTEERKGLEKKYKGTLFERKMSDIRRSILGGLYGGGGRAFIGAPSFEQQVTQAQAPIVEEKKYEEAQEKATEEATVSAESAVYQKDLQLRLQEKGVPPALIANMTAQEIEEFAKPSYGGGSVSMIQQIGSAIQKRMGG